MFAIQQSGVASSAFIWCSNVGGTLVGPTALSGLICFIILKTLLTRLGWKLFNELGLAGGRNFSKFPSHWYLVCVRMLSATFEYWLQNISAICLELVMFFPEGSVRQEGTSLLFCFTLMIPFIPFQTFLKLFEFCEK